MCAVFASSLGTVGSNSLQFCHACRLYFNHATQAHANLITHLENVHGYVDGG